MRRDRHTRDPMLLLVQPEYPPAVGGMQTHAAAIARHLHDRGHRIAVATYAQPDDADTAPSAAAYDAAQPFPTYRCLSRLSYWANLRTLLQLVEDLRPELIYSSTPFYGLLTELTGLPVVCRSVGTDVMRCWVPYPFRPGSRIVALPFVERRLEGIYQRLRTPAWVDSLFFDARRRLVQRGAPRRLVHRRQQRLHPREASGAGSGPLGGHRGGRRCGRRPLRPQRRKRAACVGGGIGGSSPTSAHPSPHGHRRPGHVLPQPVTSCRRAVLYSRTGQTKW